GGLESYAVTLMDSLSPEAIEALAAANPQFLSELAENSPDALRYLSRPALESEAVTAFLSETDDDTLKADLEAVIGGDPTAAESSLKENGDTAETFVDPDAPSLPSSWVSVASFVAADELDTADDIFNVPNYTGAADLISQFASRQDGQGLVRNLTLENWLYFAEQEATFWQNVNASALRLIDLETVDITQFPQTVQNRIAAGGEPYEPEDTVTRTDFNPSFVVSIFKEDTANTVEAWENVKVVLDEINERDDVTVDEIFEQSSFITDSLDGVVREGSTGAVMAIVMILIFMNVSFRSTAVVAVSIPGSIFFAFALIQLVPGNVHDILAPIVDDVGRDSTLGGILTVILRLFPERFTLNIMTLSGMTVAIGRVVDDAIVVLENIYRNISLLKSGEETPAAKRAAV
ncbi:MAG TPA: efflux RND transporter permease subunit, partial [Aggregatilineales bacterium]|nr:efflux RND transporter permease subunit [Aggregatilineales bacterium]